MFIKFTYNGKTHKTSKEAKTFEDLKSLAHSLFGDDSIYCDYLYEDSDSEMVCLINDEDLEICYEEAHEEGKKSIKVLLEYSSPKTKQARSLSKKRRYSGNQGVGESAPWAKLTGLEEIEFEEEDDEEAEIETRKEKLKTERKKKVEEKINMQIENLNKQMEKKMQKFKENKEKQIKAIKQKKEKLLRNASRNASKEAKGKKRGKGMPAFVKAIINQQKSNGNPKKKFNSLINSVKDDHPEFKGNPALLQKLFMKVEGSIKEILEKASIEVIQENPNLLNQGQKNKAEIQKLKNMKKAEKKMMKEEKRKQKEEEKKLKKEIQRIKKDNKKRVQEIKKRMKIAIPVFRDMPRPELRKEVVNDMNKGTDVSETIKRLLFAHEE